MVNQRIFDTREPGNCLCEALKLEKTIKSLKFCQALKIAYSAKPLITEISPLLQYENQSLQSQVQNQSFSLRL